ncbi:MAG TPA: peptidylprolyl isomerase [Methylibium sp.]
MKKLLLPAVVGTVVLSTVLSFPLIAAAQNLAMVNGKPVPKSRVTLLMSQVEKQGQAPTPQLEKQVKDEVVMREIFMQEAQKRGLQSSDTYKEQMELARQSILIRELFSDYAKKNPVTDDEIQAEYAKFKAKAGDKEYHARHILVDKEEDAKALIAKIKAGAKFEDLAKANSKDPGSAQNGGDLEWASPSSYVPEFSQALTQLQKGQMTDAPVKTSFGWHIIKLEDVRAATVPSLDEMKPQIQQFLGQQKLGAFRDELKAKAKTDYKFD